MARVQEGCFPLVLGSWAVLLLLLANGAALGAQSLPETAVTAGEPTDWTSVKDADLPTVGPLDQDDGGPSKTTVPEKPTTEAKKKATLDFDKPKPVKAKEVAKTADLETTKPLDFETTLTTTASSDSARETTLPSPATTSRNLLGDDTSSSGKPISVGIPLLARGEPVVVVVPTSTSSGAAAESTTLTTTEVTLTGAKDEPVTTTTPADVSARARALNVSASEPANTLHSNNTDLSDVSMDDEDKEVEGGEYIASHNGSTSSLPTAKPSLSPLPTVGPSPPAAAAVPLSGCLEGNRSYAYGETVRRGCEERCVCEAPGRLANCEPACPAPFVRAGRKIADPYCHAVELPNDPCCAALVCADSAPEPEESCVFGNTTIPRGQKVEDGCTRTCVCEAGGHLKCQPRCPPNDTASGINQHDRCVVLQDPRDPCCTITLCDVTLGDHEIKPETLGDLSVNLTDVKVLNTTAIKLKLSSESSDDIIVEISENNRDWTKVKPSKDGIISDLQPAHGYYVRVVEGTRAGPAIHVSLLAEVTKTGVTEKTDQETCSHNGKTYNIGAEWYDECFAICFCNQTAQTECVTIQCPTDFGLDVLDPNCLDWETVPPDHVPKAPNCCPQEVRCRKNGSCEYEGVTYDNWARIPTNVTGCEQDCNCEFGNVTCLPVCPSVPAQPPNNLNCLPHEAVLTHLADDDCCKHWTCPEKQVTLPGKNITTNVYPGPIVIETITKKPKDKLESSKPSQETPARWPMLPTHPPQPPIPPNSDVLHYPMDPGHPTIPYIGPYNPNYKPTQPSVEEVFHLPAHEKVPSVKEKTKSKSDSKKPVDTFKPIKENPDQFPGPIAPDRFLEKPHPPEKPVVTYPQIPLNPNVAVPENPNKLPGGSKGGVHSEPPDQPQFIPLEPGHNGHNFAPNNGENLPSTHFDTLLENPAAGPSYGARPEPADPNNIVPSLPKKKLAGSDIYSNEKGKPLVPKQQQRPDLPYNRDTRPDTYHEFFDLIHQNPSMINLDHGAPGGQPSLYDIQHAIQSGGISADKTQQPGISVVSNYFGPGNVPPKKGASHGKPQIFTQKDENGQLVYKVHPSEVPKTHQQFEELLTQIAEKDGNPGPHRDHYPVGQHQQQPGQPLSPYDLDPSQVNHGLPPHLGPPHGFVPPPGSPSQSGFEHIGPFQSILTQGPTHYPNQPTPEIIITELRAIDDSSIHLEFSVPHILVGLHGRVEVRYTSDKSNTDPSTWKAQAFAPPGDLIDHEALQFSLGGLKPLTTYRLMIIVNSRESSTPFSSRIYEVRTIGSESVELNPKPTERSVDPELEVVKFNATSAEFRWKKFNFDELPFIDGVYLMYKAKEDKTYSETPLLHRNTNYYVLQNLKPLTTYEVTLDIKEISGYSSTIIKLKKVNFTTSSEFDPYAFDVKLEIKTPKATEVEISWSGVPQPQEKYVNIYRAVYHTDTGKEDISTFKIAKKDTSTKTIIGDLKPGSRYLIHLELYLTNGHIKKTPVKEFVTKPGVLLPPGKLATTIPLHEGDYYGPLVIVAIVASLAILSTLILLMMLMKRRTSSKADISPRKTTSAYDNPSYKVELQQETMDL